MQEPSRQGKARSGQPRRKSVEVHDDRRSGAATCCLPSPQREKSCEKALPKDTMNGKDLALGPGWTASHPHNSPPFTAWQGSCPRAWLRHSPLCSSPCSLLLPQHGLAWGLCLTHPFPKYLHCRSSSPLRRNGSSHAAASPACSVHTETPPHAAA